MTPHTMNPRGILYMHCTEEDCRTKADKLHVKCRLRTCISRIIQGDVVVLGEAQQGLLRQERSNSGVTIAGGHVGGAGTPLSLAAVRQRSRLCTAHQQKYNCGLARICCSPVQRCAAPCIL